MRFCFSNLFIKVTFFFSAVFCTFNTQAQEVKNWSDESEVGIVKVTGNTDLENYKLKQKTIYKWDQQALTATGKYLETKSS